MIRRLDDLGRCSAKGACLQCKACLGQSNVVQTGACLLVRATFLRPSCTKMDER